MAKQPSTFGTDSMLIITVSSQHQVLIYPYAAGG